MEANTLGKHNLVPKEGRCLLVPKVSANGDKKIGRFLRTPFVVKPEFRMHVEGSPVCGKVSSCLASKSSTCIGNGG
ncbi:hypothetical protein P5673_023679 [Acropora cervicornis]|uniref:Uncharacterized protein n=1 Tax=Acropora cervicornis TaxID=6130 RepID=A0AAD9Q4P7_ACRCE|nr:hypothetical protein P5673_023679 [Acropora cervicornis]